MNNENLWFLNTLVQIRVSESEGNDRTSLTEHRVPYGDSPPLHLHVSEDEVFYILEGEFRVQADKEQKRVGPGDVVLVPKGMPHTYRVESRSGGHFLTLTRGGGFERFVRAMSRPAEREGLPPHAGLPSPEAVAQLVQMAAGYGINFVGPPLQ